MTPGEQQAKSLIYSPKGCWLIATDYGTWGAFDYARKWLGELDSPEAIVKMLAQAKAASPAASPAAKAAISAGEIDF
jgi:hypothetical protein